MRTASGPDADGSTQDGVPPPPQALSRSRGGEVGGEGGLEGASGAGAQVGQEEGEGGAGKVGEAPTEVVEALRLGSNGRYCHGRLDAVRKRHRRHQRPQQRRAEGRGMEERLEKRHGESRAERARARGEGQR